LILLWKGKYIVEPSNEELVRHLNNNRQGSVWEALDITVVSAGKDRVVATMTIGPNHRQQAGYLHGGVSVVLAESVASLGTALNTDMEKQATFGLEINANHLRPKRDGRVTAIGTPIHRGRTTHVWEIRITDENEKLICISRCTVAIVDRPPEADNPLTRDMPHFE
jgi:1,4-dihydroxy-2-naphthoyl-CoA hydrolase